MKVIMISGKSYSGKDTFANIMKRELEQSGKRCTILHYADPVKFFAKQVYNWDGVKDKAGRTLLQHLGTDCVRAYDQDYWAKTIAIFIAAIKNDFDYIFIPDARFENEINITSYYNPGAITIRINRINSDGSPYINPNFTLTQLVHPSETSLDNWKYFDYIVSNSDDMQSFEAEAKRIAKLIERK